MNFITNTLKENTILIYYLQTVSLVYEMEIEDVYEDFYEDKSLFDFSDYLQDSSFAANGGEIKKTNGVNKSVVKNIRHKENINALFNKK